MGVQEALKYGAMGFVADRIFGTGNLGVLSGAAYGGLFRPDAGEMSTAYDKRKATIGETVKNMFGFDMTDGLFGTAAKSGKAPEDLKASPERAAEQAAAREKKDGFPWGKALLAGGAAWLGVNMLDNLATGAFSPGWFAPFGQWNSFVPPSYGLGYGNPLGYGGGLGYGAGLGGLGYGLNGVLPMALTALLGFGRCNVLF